MPAIIVLLSVVAAASLAIFVMRLRVARTGWSSEREDHFVGTGTWCPTGGAVRRASWPLVRLDIVPSGIVVGPTSRWLRRLVPQVEMRWADISCVESRPTGVRINLKDTNNPALLFQ